MQNHAVILSRGELDAQPLAQNNVRHALASFHCLLHNHNGAQKYGKRLNTPA